MSEKILDWKGNEVKEGMTIYFVSTRNNVILSSRMGLLIPGTGEIWQEPEEDWIKRRDEEVWNLGQPYNVSLKDGRLFYTTMEDEEGHTFSFSLSLRNESMIAIKGISDTNT